MRKLLHSPWIIGSAVVFVMFIALVIAGYWLQWTWTGFLTKTLWDWLNLLGVLAIPIVAGFGVAWFTTKQTKASEATAIQQRMAELEKAEQQHKNELEIAEQRHKAEMEIVNDNQRETALQTYIDKISELLLMSKLNTPYDDGARNIARVRTLTVLRRLDPIRKVSLLQFLQEARLIEGKVPIINLKGADLSEVDLRDADLSQINLNEVNLSGAHMSRAFLDRASLHGANLSGADLSEANLDRTDLSGADLSGAKLVAAGLKGADLGDAKLNGADLSDAYLSLANLGSTSLNGANLSYTYLSFANLSVASNAEHAPQPSREELIDAESQLFTDSPIDEAMSRGDMDEANRLIAEDLNGADLTGADLTEAKLYKANLFGAKGTTTRQLSKARSLYGTTMPDGSKHP